MDLYAVWPAFRDHWTGAWKGFREDVLRLDAASRPFAVASVMLGALRGLIPVAGCIVLYYLIDALIGARSVGVRTSDLSHALIKLAIVWPLALVVVLGSERLRGLTRKIAGTASTIVFAVSALVCFFLAGPFRSLFLLLVFLIGETWPGNRRVQGGVLLAELLIGLSLFIRLITVLLARSLTVGGFILFGGSVVYATTWMVLRTIRREE